MAIVYKANRIEGLSSDTKPADQYNGRIFYETDTSKSFSFDGSIWNEIGGGTVSSSISYAYSQNIADYTTPTTMSASSLGEISQTLTTNQDGLTYNQVNYGAGYSYPSWKAYSGDLMSDGKNVLVHEIRVTYGTSYNMLESATLKFFNEAGSLVHSMSWGAHNNSWTAVTSSNVDLNMCRWEMITNRNMSGGLTSFQNFKFDVYLATPASVLNNGNVADRCKTTAEANPSFTADMGSSTECSHYAIYMEADSDETQYVIQYSNDDVTYTTLRTINSTDLTNGAWNYIRFNPVNARYIRIRGNSGNTKTLSATQIKVLNGITDTVASHEHLEIDTADTSLTLGGSTA